jgi:capsular exopolysaccharide synthesis family protein
VLGLFLGIGLVVGLDFLDHTLRSPDHVERYVGLETLSVVPKMTKDNERVLREAFLSLRTAVMLAARGDGCHVVMVTSAVPNEGKTTTAYNLAKTLANSGSRVLLVDADLRKPRLHRMIKAKNVRGLTSVVLGERTAAEVIHRVPNLPNLDLMTSGPLPPNPPELFGKLTFNRLLDEARTVYDWVLIDTPPVAMVTDPVICASSAEISLLVVQYGSTKREIVREAVRLLGRTGTHLAGVILNKVEVDRDPYYYSGYYSYARYGYYGDGPITQSPQTPAIDPPADNAG